MESVLRNNQGYLARHRVSLSVISKYGHIIMEDLRAHTPNALL